LETGGKMKEQIDFLDIRNAKKFDKYWDDAFDSWRKKIKEAGKKSIVIIVSPDAEKGFVEFLNKKKYRFNFIGTFSKIYDPERIQMLPATGLFYEVLF